MAMFTQSVGVPSTAYQLSATGSMRSGRRSVSACPMALASWIGATTVMSPNARDGVHQRANAFRMDTVVVGDEDLGHLNRELYHPGSRHPGGRAVLLG